MRQGGSGAACSNVPLALALIDRSANERQAFLLALAGLGGLLTVGAIQVFFALSGQSLGKRMFNLRVVRTDGAPAALWRILLLRNGLLSAANAFCGLVGLVDALFIFGEQRRCLHDLVADTIVVNAR